MSGITVHGLIMSPGGCQGENPGPHPPMSSSSGMGCSMLHMGFTAWDQRGRVELKRGAGQLHPLLSRVWNNKGPLGSCNSSQPTATTINRNHHSWQYWYSPLNHPVLTECPWITMKTSLIIIHHQSIFKKNTIKSPSSHHEGTIKSPLNITNHHCTKQNHGVPGLAVLCSRRCNCSTRATAAPCVPKHGHGIFPQESWT